MSQPSFPVSQLCHVHQQPCRFFNSRHLRSDGLPTKCPGGTHLAAWPTGSVTKNAHNSATACRLRFPSRFLPSRVPFRGYPFWFEKETNMKTIRSSGLHLPLCERLTVEAHLQKGMSSCTGPPNKNWNGRKPAMTVLLNPRLRHRRLDSTNPSPFDHWGFISFSMRVNAEHVDPTNPPGGLTGGFQSEGFPLKRSSPPTTSINHPGGCSSWDSQQPPPGGKWGATPPPPQCGKLQASRDGCSWYSATSKARDEEQRCF